MKPRCLLFIALTSSFFLTGCPENTYPAGEKDAYPLTDYQVFYDATKGKSDHDKAEKVRDELAHSERKRQELLDDSSLSAPDRQKLLDALPLERQKMLDALPDLATKEKTERDGLDKLRPTVRRILAKLYGSPEHPAAPPMQATTVDIRGVFELHANEETEEPGSPLDTGRKLYKQHCMHCHGFYGYGDGPTADFLLPKPRDFRYGKVKFTSTKGGMRPVHDDLVRTIAQGLQGTMMPAFGPSEGIPRIGIFAGHAGPPNFDVDAVASYVEVLLLRGAIEQQLAAKWNDDGELNPDNAQAAVDQILREWKDATASVVTAESPRPTDFEASAKKGEELFGYIRGEPTDKDRDEARKKATAGCFTCHGIHGLGTDSAPADIGALAGGVAAKAAADKTLLQPNDYKLPSMPLNLTLGVYRGGRRPIDLYRRFDAGIKGTPMPGQHGNLTSEQIWNVVDFVYKLGMPKPEKPE